MCISAVMHVKIAVQLQMVKRHNTRYIPLVTGSNLNTTGCTNLWNMSESSTCGRPEIRLFPEENTCCTSSECLSELLRRYALIVSMVHMKGDRTCGITVKQRELQVVATRDAFKHGIQHSSPAILAKHTITVEKQVKWKNF